ncbi:MAG: 4-hydroxy-3-methylbut-2-en-1-yl diphosphate synthase [Flavobacteriales bacterium]|nr:4-hydroxy-3-methylbut-2-en-1-yl diphosphate synthase [Flavobacteriales bacterium]
MPDYCNSLTNYSRRKSRKVKIGSIALGGDEPIRIQSMTTTDTMDTNGTVEQSIRMIEAGSELVRITAPSKKDAENLAPIKEEIRKAGYETPLVADIHFTPNAAEIAAGIVEKVRVNPGNYADKKKFEVLEYTDETYQAELERIEERFTPLVKLCKENGTAMRIGTNHGSLSDRILSRYGDTPLGMVESALEFLRICRKHDYHEIVLSMKASNTIVMVEAYRLLVAKMEEEGMDYPLHLGVTEAGDGEDGRIKSAVGIGTLLEDGLGDTIRVSLTEEPEAELPVARKLVDRYKNRKGHPQIPEIENYPIDPFEFQKRHANEILNIGGEHVPVVIGDLSRLEKISQANFFPLGYNYSVPLDKWNIKDQAVDYIYLGDRSIDFEISGTLSLIQNYNIWKDTERKDQRYPFLKWDERGNWNDIDSALIFQEFDLQEAGLDALKELKPLEDKLVLVAKSSNPHAVAEIRRIVVELINLGINCPVLVKRSYSNLDEEQFQLDSAVDFGALLVDGLIDGVWIDAQNCGGQQMVTSTAFGILQASRSRISKTEYISCPSCGRTLFDLQETTAKIRKVTSHLKGVKIGIMGCIVNGPGEMADAHYGYVGTGPGKITLYKEKEVVRRNVPEAEAVDALIQLIDEHGDWIDPVTE